MNIFKTKGSGLVNVGNSCYANRTLQILFHVPLFAQWLSQDTEHHVQCSDMECQDCITCALAETHKLHLQGATFPSHLANNYIEAYTPRMVPGMQQDAAECLLFLLDRLAEECTARKEEYRRREGILRWTTPVRLNFYWLTTDTVICPKGCQVPSQCR
jgi:uncharacterized UBP type Zn finger protein